MKKIGIVGGLAWGSTADYYRLLCEKTNRHFEAEGCLPPLPTPHMLIESVNMSETRRLRGRMGDEESWKQYDKFFSDTLNRLKSGGAEIGAIASNTPHMRLHSFIDDTELPVVSILDSTVDAVIAIGKPYALVLGTSVTMESDVYISALSGRGISPITDIPSEEVERLERLINVDLYQNKIEGAATEIVELCRRLIGHRNDVAVCLACTELPLAFPEFADDAFFDVDGIQFVNTTVAHVEAILESALS